MYKQCVFIFFAFILAGQAQKPLKESNHTKQDTAKKTAFLNKLGNGFFPTKYINIDLKYLLKYNQYEGFRTGLGGETSKQFSEKMKLNAYSVYGFIDKQIKYGIGVGFRVAKKTNTWINLSHKNDLQETGSSTFLTDKRFFSFFEPRLLNINLFHQHITNKISLSHNLSSHILSETEFSVSNIMPTYNYTFNLKDKIYDAFEVTMIKTSVQWNPFSHFEMKDGKVNMIKDGYPKFTFQFSKSLKGLLKSSFNFSKIDFRTNHKINYKNKAFSFLTLTAGLANGDIPLTHLYHAYPNNIDKQTIGKRFSVAGINSFETMFFNEFFSNKLITFQFKHYFSSFKISKKFKPQLVLITRYAYGETNNATRHQGISFSELNKGYTESGIEINKLFFGFGLSFSYRYGAYHLPRFDDNIALKFTFNVTL